MERTHFFVNGILSHVVVDATLPKSLHFSQGYRPIPLRVVVTGPDLRGNNFSTPLIIDPSTQPLPASYVLGQDWIQLSHINAACECIYPICFFSTDLSSGNPSRPHLSD